MLFNSVQFVVFFVVVTSLYFIIPFKFRWALLLIASCYFYMAFVPIYILILGFTIVVDYYAGIYLEETNGKSRKYFLVLSLIANIGILCVFKYYNFLNYNLTLLLGGFSLNNPVPFLKILLPIGLSFHTFQAMSYTIEVYRGNQKAERNFGIYALYVMFYPQLVAGPIERPQNMLHQFYEKHELNYENISEGLKLMLQGFFKKLVVADRAALYVNTIYNGPRHFSGITLLFAAVLFSFQIYSDFSGYSDIAIGCAKVMGFNLMTNFNQPFSSKNITEFWRKWHISLSTWFNDYLFTPLNFNYRHLGKLGVVLALMITFSVSGLWHGAGFTFIIFGMLHGVAISYEFLTKKIRKKVARAMPKFLYNSLSIALTFSFATLTWVFFRAKSVSDSFYILKHAFIFNKPLFYESPSEIFFPILGIILLMLIENKIGKHQNKSLPTIGNNWIVKHFYYAVMLILILLIGVFDGGQFIYFQF